ncbi:MAG TPA: hypothetical protein VHC22_08335 [Pirellulales bacterium]|nr:hypothetical protein [Pirellulales bacterium]
MDVQTLLKWIDDQVFKANMNIDYNQVMAWWLFWIDLTAKLVPGLFGVIGTYYSSKREHAKLSFKISLVSIFITVFLLACPTNTYFATYDIAAREWRGIELSLEKFRQQTETSDLADDEPIDARMIDAKADILQRIAEVERPESAAWRLLLECCYRRQTERLWGEGIDSLEKATAAKAGKPIPTTGDWSRWLCWPSTPFVLALIVFGIIASIALRILGKPDDAARPA